MVELEICANSLTSALAAQNGGATRVEFCDNLNEGGTTPSYGQLVVAKRMLSIPIYPIIRPRGGDFLYSDLEFEIMQADVIACRELGCAGVVFGILMPDGSIDVQRCLELKSLAGPMQVSFHRAFDMTSDLSVALETLIDMGVERVLTSGGFPTALEGAAEISRLVQQAAGRIQIMPGAGIRPANVKQLLALTSAPAVHASLLSPVQSEMLFRNEAAKMGSITDEYAWSTTSLTMVREMVSALFV
jgi:copper homeostasis protein